MGLLPPLGRLLLALGFCLSRRGDCFVFDGREAVGLTVGIPKRKTAKPDQPRDALDDLMDGLDSLEL